MGLKIEDDHPYCVFISRDVCCCSEGNGTTHRLYRFENRERNGLSYSERRMAIELELTVTLDDDAIGNLCCQSPISADYDGLGARGTKIVFPLLT